MAHLLIQGKTIDITNIEERTEAQFLDKLRRNGIAVDEKPERYQALYHRIIEQNAKEAEREAQRAERKADFAKLLKGKANAQDPEEATVVEQ